MYTFEPFVSVPIIFALLLADFRTLSVSAVTVPTLVVWLVWIETPDVFVPADFGGAAAALIIKIADTSARSTPFFLRTDMIPLLTANCPNFSLLSVKADIPSYINIIFCTYGIHNEQFLPKA